MAAGVTFGQSTGRKTQTSFVAARQPGDDSGHRRPHVDAVVEHVERQLELAALPTASRSSHASPSVAPRPLRQRLALEARERLRRAEPLARAADEQDAVRDDAPRLAVDVHPALADEAAERDAAVARELDGERRRRADGDEQRTARDGRLLHELEREPAADAEDRVGERQPAVEERPADHLVHRVVPADVLAQRRAARRRRRTGPSRAARPSPRTPPAGAQALRQRRDELRRDLQIALDARRLDRDGLERALAAHAARRRRVEAAPQALGVEVRRLELDRVRCEVVGRTRAARARPSESAKPSASSSSWPGVRIVTATGTPPMRISSGSSTATTSSAAPSGNAHDVDACRRVRRRFHRRDYARAPACCAAVDYAAVSMNEWLQAAVAGLGGDLELSSDEMRALLDLAAHAAHESGNRTNAPLVCYLVGRLQGDRDLATVVEEVRSATS